MNDIQILTNLFNKSKKQFGYIYLAKTKNYYKYGKTKDINKRFNRYSNDYSLMFCNEVNHMSLREELIRHDSYIKIDRYENLLDERNEHHTFDITNIVEWYSKCDIKMQGSRLICTINDEEVSKPLSFLINTIHF